MTPPNEPKNLRIMRNGYELHAQYLAAHSAGAPCLVFGNSLVTDLGIWDAQVAALSGSFAILRYDQAGHGKSGLPPEAITFDDLGADLLAVMDTANISRGIYIGLSMGVPTGLAAHRIAPDRFDAFVFSDGQAKTAAGGAQGWAERIADAQAHGMAAFAAKTAERWLVPSTAPALKERLTDMIAATPFEGFQRCATALMDYDYADELPKITCPSLLIAGAEDGAMPQGMARNLQPAIANSQMEVIAQAGHVPCFEQSGAFTDVLRGFLTGQVMGAGA